MLKNNLKILLLIVFCLFITFINNAKADNIAISTCEELRDMSPLSGDFYLTQDINCSDTSTWNSGSGWIPLGTFTGNLDGQDFAITNLYIDRSSTDYVGLFSEITGGNISNLSLTNIDITGQDYVGGLAGTITASSAIENITISGSITGNSELGGIAGDSYDSSFEDCISSINVTGTYNQGSVGGLLGSVYDGTTITSCSASGDISGGYSAGGLVGSTYNTSSISNSYATGDVSGASYNTAGLVGYNYSTISNSWASGTVTVANIDGTNTGGLAGENYSTISNSWASGTVTTVDNDNVGGLVGLNGGSGIIEKSYSTGAAVTSEGENIGGLVGLNSATIRKSYSTKNVEGSNLVGGLAGVSTGAISDCYSNGNVVVTGGLAAGFLGINSGGSVSDSYSTGTVTGAGALLPFMGDGGPNASNSYWDVDTSEIGGSGDNNLGATGKTTTQMKNITTFSSWDISEGSSYSDPSIWYIDNSNDYPRLLNDPDVDTLDPTEITNDGVTLKGLLKYFYDLNVHFQYREVGASTWTNTSVQLLEDTGEYELELSSLDSDEEFEFRAVVSNGDTDLFGETVSFSTLKESPSISSNSASNVYPVSAKLRGEITSMGDYNSVQVAFRYREVGEEEWITTENEEVLTVGAFEKVINSLSVGTEYEYQAKITFGDDSVSYGNLVTFTTLYGKVSVITYTTTATTTTAPVTTTTTIPQTTTTTTSTNVIPQPEKPIAEMNQAEKNTYTMQLQQFLIQLLTQLLSLLAK